jgi:shikimate 5-dehydrogenase
MSPASATRLFALLGLPVAGNPTQEMVEAALESAGLDARYVSFDVEPAALPGAVAGARALGLEGLHVTVPHKVAVVSLLDRLTAAAAASGAVNCVKREGTLLVGDNTDGKGFLASLRDLMDPAGAFAVVVGAGGAARAVIAPPETAFPRDAEAHGYRTLSGLGMLVEQAAIGFRWWTGRDADRGVMQTALERELGLARQPRAPRGA